ncbi:MAG: glycoside hydrolase family 10 protein [Candidatus Cyclobacteriaceae bacterium M2_1C_046]
MNLKHLLISCFCFLLIYSVSAQDHPPKKEFRGIWIATVANIDWPKSRGLSEEKQKEQFNEILDFYQNLNFNVAVVQIRAAGDAFYPTEKAPWSRFLMGTENYAPDTLYDPLEWMIEETHKRGMEFHAWLNPYRATTDLDTAILDEQHAFYQHPEWMVKYGTKYYFNPGLPEVKEHVVDVISEVVRNYDIDAIHFDDYFYPYKITNQIFDDSLQYQQYAAEGQSIDDWRRSNVSALIQECSEMIKREKPWVQFGISPFGVWRNAAMDSTGSSTRAGQTTYDDLYADVLKWMRERWIDYNVPQLYWSMDYPAASHRILVDWWSKQAGNSNIYIGHGLYKVKANPDKAWNKIKEIPRQIELTRAKQEIDGSVFFSAKSIMGRHRRLSRQILRKYYKYPALPPASPFINKTPAEVDHNVEVVERNDKYQIKLQADQSDSLRYVITYRSKNKNPINLENPEMILSKIYLKQDQPTYICLPKKGLKKGKPVVLTFLDKYGIESRPYYYMVSKVGDKIVIQPNLM